MKKSILFTLITLTAVGVYGVSNLIDTNVPPTGFPSIETFNNNDVTYSIKWNKYVKTYFIYFTNSSSHTYDISFEYYSETSGKYIENALVLGKFAQKSACCGERKAIRNLTIIQREE